MRALIAALVALAFALPVQASGLDPHLRDDLPYVKARAHLIAQGFRPVPVRTHGLMFCSNNGHICRWAPEVVNCTSGGASQCKFLYLRSRDDRLMLIWTRDEEPLVTGFSWATADDIRDAAQFIPVLKRDRRIVNVALARLGPRPETPAPLCTEPHVNTPCWIKPPAGYRK